MPKSDGRCMVGVRLVGDGARDKELVPSHETQPSAIQRRERVEINQTESFRSPRQDGIGFPASTVQNETVGSRIPFSDSNSKKGNGSVVVDNISYIALSALSWTR